MIIGDIGSYCGHRWSHEISLLRHFQRIHHQAETIDWLVSSRALAFDLVFKKLSGVALIYFSGLAQGSLGQGTALMSTHLIVAGLWAYFVHASTNWRFAPWRSGWPAPPSIIGITATNPVR